ncbi:6-phospho-3-hexuloisomerase [Geomicrobium sp. JCM 19037]|uniref:6-phospho-3-hexuloisomerase n=1 Tax=Geomicrobium sp. JCM 19037 TaxID=1460634 RepID=UPI00045F28BA|nr:6-phospho-3-hexuloisomerase [Geomicrobium sp. JCM 19037]GAK05134.1 6-phospho-3-hexuloisomerase [Geomicrobium sp. JCM 19037]
MSTFQEVALSCVKEVQSVVSNVKEEQMHAFALAIKGAKRIFVSGEGRSGLMGKAIAMRLMHADYTVYVTGETITPSISDGDLLVIISGSASGTQSFISKAKQAGASVALVTANPEQEKSSEADHVFLVPAATKKRLNHEPVTIQPLGNQFDQSVHVLLDAIIVKLTTNQHEQMTARHANLELS